MAKLTKRRVRVGDREYFMEVEFDVNINVDGEFTATLKEEDARLIESLGVTLSTNGKSNGRKGFIRADSIAQLYAQVKNILEICMSRNLIEDKIVLKYHIATACSFGLTMSGDIVPNMGWSLDGPLNQDAYWQGGNVSTNAVSPPPVGVQMYVKPYHKRTYEYKDGRKREEYSVLTPFGGGEVSKDKYYLKYLENIVSTSSPSGGTYGEIDYTEDRARFFVELFKGLCKLANTIANFSSVDKIIELAESQKYLMYQPKENEE